MQRKKTGNNHRFTSDYFVYFRLIKDNCLNQNNITCRIKTVTGNQRFTLIKMNFIAYFYGWGPTVSRTQSHLWEIVDFLPLSP